jgi:serine/threonine-protein kinase
LHAGNPFIVMELLEGEELRAKLRNEAVPILKAIDYAEQIAAGLAIAHEKGTIHRDLKPENLFVTNDGRVKILDFGLAKLAGSRKSEVGSRNEEAATLLQGEPNTPQSPIPNPQLTTPGTVMGTASYMSPEQARGEKVDARSDIFSLGVVLYEMLAGQRPFAGANMLDVVGAILHQEPKPLPVHNEAVPPELQRIISKALQKDQEQRYQTAKDLLTDLKTLKEEMAFAAKLKGNVETVSQRQQSAIPNPQSAIEPTTTSSAKIILGEIKRHKLAVFMTLLVLVAAATGIGLYLRPQKTEAPIDSLAVLPFTNQNRAEETEYLADGLTESIINNLTQLAQLRVVNRNSAFRYKGKEDDPLNAGQALGVRAVVVGRVLQRGENLTVSAELVDVRDNRQIEGWKYNRKLADVFAVQEEIAREISEKLRLKLTGAEQQQLAKRYTENLKAWQNYMQAVSFLNRRTREDLLTAIGYCEQAIAEDQNYALAYAGLAHAYANLGVRNYLAPSEARRKTEAAARKALSLDENLAESHVAMSHLYLQFVPYNLPLAEQELRRAIELNPNLALAHMVLTTALDRQGRLAEAAEEVRKARALDPLAPIIVRAMARNYLFRRDYTRALEVLRQANELGSPFSTIFDAHIYTQNGLFDEALAELEKASAERKNDPLLIASKGQVYAAQGKRPEALQRVKELEEMPGMGLSQTQYIATIYAALKEKEQSLAWLERGVAAGEIGAFFKDAPVWDTIRSDVRFGDLLRRMGVPQ